MKKRGILYLLAACMLLPVVLVLSYVGAKDNKKIAYITFDDGPTLNTPSIVQTLDKYGASATFFVLEERIVMYPEFIKGILRSGNAIGLHGVSHSEAIYKTPTSVLWEMDKANKALEALTAKRSSLVRVPFGSSYRLTHEQAEHLMDNGYIIWDWNVDPRDSVGKIVPQRVMENLKKGLSLCKDSPVILFHDRKSTANLLPEVLEYLKSEGYTMEAISEKQTPVNQLKE